MWVDYRGPLSTVYNDGEISTYGWTIEVHSVQSTMMGRSQYVGRLHCTHCRPSDNSWSCDPLSLLELPNHHQKVVSRTIDTPSHRYSYGQTTFALRTVGIYGGTFSGDVQSYKTGLYHVCIWFNVVSFHSPPLSKSR